MSDCCLTTSEQFSSISWGEQVTFRWDDDVHNLLDQQAELDFYNSSSLKKQCTGRHVAQHGDTILILSQPVCSYS